MGGFTNVAAGVGSSLLPAALDYAAARSGYEQRAAAARQDINRLNQLHALDRESYANIQSEADRLVADAQAEAERRLSFLDMETQAQRAAQNRWNDFSVSKTQAETDRAEAQARAEAEAAQRRLESEQARRDIEAQKAEAERAEAARLRAEDLKKAQAAARARFGASGLSGSVSVGMPTRPKPETPPAPPPPNWPGRRGATSPRYGNRWKPAGNKTCWTSARCGNGPRCP
jgi:hypothetical protein